MLRRMAKVDPPAGSGFSERCARIAGSKRFQLTIFGVIVLNAIVLGRDTYDSCVRAQRIFGVTRALVVSQAYHVPRAVAICRSVGLDVDGVGDVDGADEWSVRQPGQ